MGAWNVIAGVLYHGLQGRWRLGGLAPAEEFDEAVTKGQLSEFDGPISFDFTDTLSFVSKEDFSVDSGEMFIPGPGWIPVSADGPGIVTVFENTDALIYQGVFDLGFDSGFGILPVISSGEFYEVKTGQYAGSVLSNDITKDPGNAISTSFTAQVKDGEDNRSYGIFCTVRQDESVDGLSIEKVNEVGERVQMSMGNTLTGFRTLNTLSDNTASIHRFENNNAETILDLLNDNLQSDVLLANDFVDDAAAEVGGVPVGGLYHNAGALRIRIA